MSIRLPGNQFNGCWEAACSKTGWWSCVLAGGTSNNQRQTHKISAGFYGCFMWLPEKPKENKEALTLLSIWSVGDFQFSCWWTVYIFAPSVSRCGYQGKPCWCWCRLALYIKSQTDWLTHSLHVSLLLTHTHTYRGIYSILLCAPTHEGIVC